MGFKKQNILVSFLAVKWFAYFSENEFVQLITKNTI